MVDVLNATTTIDATTTTFDVLNATNATNTADVDMRSHNNAEVFYVTSIVGVLNAT